MPSALALARAFVLGVATGGRSSAGPAAVVWSASAAISDRDPLWLSTRAARVGTAVIVGGEVVNEKRPSTPSRLIPPVLAGRVAVGAAAGGFLGRRYALAVGPAALAGGLGGLAGSFAGARWRGWAAKRFGPDLPGALIEDAVVAGLAFTAVR